VSKHFTGPKDAEAYVRKHDADVAQLHKGYTNNWLRALEDRELRESGGERLAGGPQSRDELVASILELRWPLIAEARAVLAGPEPGSETVTFTFPGGAQVTVPPMPEDPRVTAPAPMSDEDILKLVQEDSGSDYNEGVGEFGGYVDWHVENGVLIVTVRPYTAEADDDPSGPIVRKWRLVPVEDEAAPDLPR
jgi:hypothetical protein